MTCVHLKQLFRLCEENDLRFSSSDLVHIVCKQCERDEVCPSLLVNEYEAQFGETEADGDAQAEPGRSTNDQQSSD